MTINHLYSSTCCEYKFAIRTIFANSQDEHLTIESRGTSASLFSAIIFLDR